jgi:hypothetical protein
MSNDDITTKPTIEAVLERINKLGESMMARFDALESEVASVRAYMDTIKSEMSALRIDMQKGFQANRTEAGRTQQRNARNAGRRLRIG